MAFPSSILGEKDFPFGVPPALLDYEGVFSQLDEYVKVILKSKRVSSQLINEFGITCVKVLDSKDDCWRAAKRVLTLSDRGTEKKSYIMMCLIDSIIRHEVKGGSDENIFGNLFAEHITRVVKKALFVFGKTDGEHEKIKLLLGNWIKKKHFRSVSGKLKKLLEEMSSLTSNLYGTSMSYEPSSYQPEIVQRQIPSVNSDDIDNSSCHVRDKTRDILDAGKVEKRTNSESTKEVELTKVKGCPPTENRPNVPLNNETNESDNQRKKTVQITPLREIEKSSNSEHQYLPSEHRPPNHTPVNINLSTRHVKVRSSPLPRESYRHKSRDRSLRHRSKSSNPYISRDHDRSFRFNDRMRRSHSYTNDKNGETKRGRNKDSRTRSPDRRNSIRHKRGPKYSITNEYNVKRDSPEKRFRRDSFNDERVRTQKLTRSRSPMFSQKERLASPKRQIQKASIFTSTPVDDVPHRRFLAHSSIPAKAPVKSFNPPSPNKIFENQQEDHRHTRSNVRLGQNKEIWEEKPGPRTNINPGIKNTVSQSFSRHLEGTSHMPYYPASIPTTSSFPGTMSSGNISNPTAMLFSSAAGLGYDNFNFQGKNCVVPPPPAQYTNQGVSSSHPAINGGAVYYPPYHNQEYIGQGTNMQTHTNPINSYYSPDLHTSSHLRNHHSSSMGSDTAFSVPKNLNIIVPPADQIRADKILTIDDSDSEVEIVTTGAVNNRDINSVVSPGSHGVAIHQKSDKYFDETPEDLQSADFGNAAIDFLDSLGSPDEIQGGDAMCNIMNDPLKFSLHDASSDLVEEEAEFDWN